MSSDQIAKFDTFGAFQLTDVALLDEVAGGGVAILQSESTPTDANCLNGVCFDEGNTACVALNPLCSPPKVPQRLNPICDLQNAMHPPQNAPCTQNMRCIPIYP